MLNWLSAFLLNPALAIGGAAVASPILIHLFSKRRLRRVRWAAMDFLLKAYRKNRRRIRLEQIILLVLRCLAVLLVALMVMRPFVRSGALGALSGLRGRTERIIILDDSYSTHYISPRGAAGGQTVFVRLKEAAKQLAERSSEESPADTMTIVLSSQPREPFIALPSLSEEKVRDLKDRLDTLSPTEGIARMQDALKAVTDLIRAAPTQANHVLYVLSDFQRGDWTAPLVPSNDNRGGVSDPLSSFSDRGRSVQLVLIDGAVDTPPANVAITDLRSMQSKIVASVPARFEVAVSNYSNRPLDRVEFSLRTSRHTLPPVLIPTLAAGQTVRTPVEVAFGQEGSDFLEAHLVGGSKAADGLAIDNVRIDAVEVAPAVSVLVVNGEPSTDTLRDEVYLFCTALHPAGRAVSGNDPTVIEEHELEVADLAGHDVVVLANVARVTAGAQRKLEQFVQAGGGLLVFAGDQVDPEFYNDRLYNNGRGLLPAAVSDVVVTPSGSEPFAFSDWQTGNSVMRDFVNQLAAVLRQVRVFAFLGVRQESLATTTSAPSLGPTSRPDLPGTTVIARFNDADKSPAILERSFGRGRCILVTTSVDQEWNNWPASFSYLPVMLKLVQYAARQATSEGNAMVGAALACPLDTTGFSPRALLRTPAYPIEPEIVLEAPKSMSRPASQPAFGAVTNIGTTLLQTSETSKSGIYQFQLHRSTGEGITHYAAVNPDPAESNLAQASRAEIEAVLGSSKFEYVRDIGSFTARAFDPRTELWWPILIMAIVVLMIEHSLAWWFGTRG